MQTFLPYTDYERSAATLDNARLNKQAVENLQIAEALCGRTQAYIYHPAVLMWAGAERSFWRYTMAIGHEIERRGRDSIAIDRARLVLDEYIEQHPISTGGFPWWLRLPRFHAAMRGNLVRKAPDHYRPLFPKADPDLEYQWPVRSIDKVLHYHPRIEARHIPPNAPVIPKSKRDLYRKGT